MRWHYTADAVEMPSCYRAGRGWVIVYALSLWMQSSKITADQMRVQIFLKKRQLRAGKHEAKSCLRAPLEASGKERGPFRGSTLLWTTADEGVIGTRVFCTMWDCRIPLMPDSPHTRWSLLSRSGDRMGIFGGEESHEFRRLGKGIASAVTEGDENLVGTQWHVLPQGCLKTSQSWWATLHFWIGP